MLSTSAKKIVTKQRLVSSDVYEKTTESHNTSWLKQLREQLEAGTNVTIAQIKQGLEAYSTFSQAESIYLQAVLNFIAVNPRSEQGAAFVGQIIQHKAFSSMFAGKNLWAESLITCLLQASIRTEMFIELCRNWKYCGVQSSQHRALIENLRFSMSDSVDIPRYILLRTSYSIYLRLPNSADLSQLNTRRWLPTLLSAANKHRLIITDMPDRTETDGFILPYSRLDLSAPTQLNKHGSAYFPLFALTRDHWNISYAAFALTARNDRLYAMATEFVERQYLMAFNIAEFADAVTAAASSVAALDSLIIKSSENLLDYPSFPLSGKMFKYTGKHYFSTLTRQNCAATSRLMVTLQSAITMRRILVCAARQYIVALQQSFICLRGVIEMLPVQIVVRLLVDTRHPIIALFEADARLLIVQFARPSLTLPLVDALSHSWQQPSVRLQRLVEYTVKMVFGLYEKRPDKTLAQRSRAIHYDGRGTSVRHQALEMFSPPMVTTKLVTAESATTATTTTTMPVEFDESAISEWNETEEECVDGGDCKKRKYDE